jgi:hypothetical protein
MGKTTFRTNDLITTDPNNTVQKVFDENIIIDSINSVSIPAYSLGYIIVNIKKKSKTCNCTNQSQYRKANSNINLLEETNISKTNLYPNPTTGIVNLYFANDKLKELQITDIAGNIIKNITTYNYEITLDMSNYAKGIYFYNIIYSNGEIESSKFIIK